MDGERVRWMDREVNREKGGRDREVNRGRERGLIYVANDLPRFSDHTRLLFVPLLLSANRESRAERKREGGDRERERKREGGDRERGRERERERERESHAQTR